MSLAKVCYRNSYFLIDIFWNILLIIIILDNRINYHDTTIFLTWYLSLSLFCLLQHILAILREVRIPWSITSTSRATATPLMIFLPPYTRRMLNELNTVSPLAISSCYASTLSRRKRVRYEEPRVHGMLHIILWPWMRESWKFEAL